MAQRCVEGDFGGIANRASQEPEAAELGIDRQMIQYFMDRYGPIAASTRGAERAQPEHEKSEAKIAGEKLRVVVVEKGGGRSARTLVHELQRQEESKTKKRSRESAAVATLARTQAELEQAAAETPS